MKTNLKQLRKKSNLTQEQLAERIGRTKGVVGYWERGTTELMLEDACAICDALHCTLDELAGRKPPYNQVTREESEMLQEFRTLDLRQQSVIKQSVHTMSPRYHEVMEKKQSDAKVG